MVLGLGTDMVEIARIERAVARRGERFLGRVFTPGERRDCFRKASRCESLAARFAAKEAAFKALGRGLFECGGFPSVEIVVDGGGRPEIVFRGRALRIAEEMGVRRSFVSLAHDGGFAVATVVLEG